MIFSQQDQKSRGLQFTDHWVRSCWGRIWRRKPRQKHEQNRKWKYNTVERRETFVKEENGEGKINIYLEELCCVFFFQSLLAHLQIHSRVTFIPFPLLPYFSFIKKIKPPPTFSLHLYLQIETSCCFVNFINVFPFLYLKLANVHTQPF